MITLKIPNNPQLPEMVFTPEMEDFLLNLNRRSVSISSKVREGGLGMLLEVRLVTYFLRAMIAANPATENSSSDCRSF